MTTSCHKLNDVLQPQLMRFVPALLPNGEQRGNEWVALNPTRPDRNLGSFRINMTTGKWADFATGDKGQGLASLYAYITGVDYRQASQVVTQMAGVSNDL